MACQLHLKLCPIFCLVCEKNWHTFVWFGEWEIFFFSLKNSTRWRTGSCIANNYSTVFFIAFLFTFLLPRSPFVLLRSAALNLCCFPSFFSPRFLCSLMNFWAIAVIELWSNWQPAFLKEELAMFSQVHVQPLFIYLFLLHCAKTTASYLWQHKLQ